MLAHLKVCQSMAHSAESNPCGTGLLLSKTAACTCLQHSECSKTKPRPLTRPSVASHACVQVSRLCTASGNRPHALAALSRLIIMLTATSSPGGLLPGKAHKLPPSSPNLQDSTQTCPLEAGCVHIGAVVQHKLLVRVCIMDLVSTLGSSSLSVCLQAAHMHKCKHEMIQECSLAASCAGDIVRH